MSRPLDSSEVVKVIADAVPHMKLNLDDFGKSFALYGMDSLDTSAIFMNIENHYDVTISDEEFETLDTVNDIVAFLTKARGEAT